MDSVYLRKLYAQVEDKLQWGDSKEWTNSQFIQLSDRVSTASKISISSGTLKRMFGKVKTSEDYNPQIETKNALSVFLGYRDWNDFKTRHRESIAEKETTPEVSILTKKSNKWLILPLLIGTGFLIYALIQNKPSPEIAKLSSFKLSGYAPQTILFNYSIKNIKTDSLFLNFGDSEKIVLLKDKNTITHYFRLPEYYKTKIISGGKTLDSLNIHILTSGWEPIIIKDQNPIPTVSNVTFPADKEKYSKQNLLLNPQDMQQSGVDTNEVYWTEYRNIKSIEAEGDNFTLETKVKNSVKVGKVLCNHIILNVIGETERIKAYFVKPGCSRWVSLRFGELNQSGADTDFNTFERDFSEWRKIKLEVKNKKVKIFYEDNEIYSTEYKNSIGKIKGLIFTFSGAGEIDYINLLDKKNKLILSDTFTNSMAIQQAGIPHFTQNP